MHARSVCQSCEDGRGRKTKGWTKFAQSLPGGDDGHLRLEEKKEEIEVEQLNSIITGRTMGRGQISKVRGVEGDCIEQFHRQFHHRAR
jgi:hypothetical protein